MYFLDKDLARWADPDVAMHAWSVDVEHLPYRGHHVVVAWAPRRREPQPPMHSVECLAGSSPFCTCARGA